MVITVGVEWPISVLGVDVGAACRQFVVTRSAASSCPVNGLIAARRRPAAVPARRRESSHLRQIARANGGRDN
jgi:hypothetical protein